MPLDPGDDSVAIMPILKYRRHILDHHEARPKNLRRPSHPEVQSIFLVDPARVVVQVAVSLARRTADQSVERSDLCAGDALAECQRGTQITVEQIFDGCGRDPAGSGEVLAVDGGRHRFEVDREADLQRPSSFPNRLRDSEGQPAAACEEVHHAERRCSGFELRPAAPRQRRSGRTHRREPKGFLGRHGKTGRRCPVRPLLEQQRAASSRRGLTQPPPSHETTAPWRSLQSGECGGTVPDGLLQRRSRCQHH